MSGPLRSALPATLLALALVDGSATSFQQRPGAQPRKSYSANSFVQLGDAAPSWSVTPAIGFDLQGPMQPELAESRQRLAGMLQTDPHDAALRFIAARLARRAGDYSAAWKHLEEYRKLIGETEPGRLEHRLLRAQDGEVDAVGPDLQNRAQKNRPEAPLILEALARGYLEDGRPGEGLRILNEWLQQQPDNPRALLWHGWLMQHGGNDWAGSNDWSAAHGTGAVDDFRRAVNAAPEWQAARLALADALVQANQAKEALVLYERVLKARPAQPEARLGLARCRVLLGQTEAAAKVLDDLVKDQPHSGPALVERGKLAMQEGRPAEAEGLLRRALKEEPSDRQAVYQLTLCLEQQRKTKDAQQQRMHLQAIERDQARLHEILAKMLPAAPRDLTLRAEAGAILLRNGQEKQGLRWLLGILRIDPEHRPTHQVLAEYYERAGNRELAEHHHRYLRPK